MFMLCCKRKKKKRMITWSSRFLNLLSWRTFLMATISPVSQSLAWYTTPKLPLPITLGKRQCFETFFEQIRTGWISIIQNVKKCSKKKTLQCGNVFRRLKVFAWQGVKTWINYLCSQIGVKLNAWALLECELSSTIKITEQV